MPATILQKDSADTIAKHNNYTWNDESEGAIVTTKAPAFEADESKVPWVKIANLYTSISPTGNKSWIPIIRDLQKAKKDQKFTIVSGRHGDRMGQEVNLVGGTFMAEVLDPNESKADNAVADPLEAELWGIAVKDLAKKPEDRWIKVVDSTAAKLTTLVALKTFTANELAAGRVVIWAWCFSLLGQREHPNHGRFVVAGKKITVKAGGKEIPTTVIRSHAKLAITTPIKQIVVDDLKWVK